jgi:NAD(P)-dependent dehydrogenase (short-subunit alcohol dehydrogenase family)
MKKKVLIIGGSSGIGLAAARLAVEQGFEVVIASRSSDKLERALATLDGQYISSEVVDTLDDTSIHNLFSRVGNIDHLVIAGSEVTFGDFKTMPIDQMKQSFDSKLFGPVRVIRIAAEYIKTDGSITLFSGSAGARPENGTEIISAINSSVESLSRALAVSMAPVRVNTIAPGLIDTPAYDGMSDADKQAMFVGFTKNFPLNHVGHVDDVAEAALYLIKSNYATGSTVYVDGGHALR